MVRPQAVSMDNSVALELRTVHVLARHMKFNAAAGWMTLITFPLACRPCPAAPSIIPLPSTLQTRPGFFTLCPSVPVAGVPARATRRILVDNGSLASGQYLATMLFKSTGCQFAVVTSNTDGP